MSNIGIHTNFFGIGSGGIGSLFGQTNNSAGSIFSNASLYKGFSEVNSLGYKKLLKAYYAEENTDETDKSSTRKDNLEKLLDQQDTGKKNAAKAKELKNDAAAVKSGADKLTAVDEENNSTLFSKSREEIDSAVKGFVKDYNSMIQTVSTSSYSNTRMSDLNSQLSALSKANKYTLDRAGITVNNDGSLTIREKDYAAADTQQLKSVFGSADSFAARAGQKAEYVAENAQRYTNDTYGTYNRNSNYGNVLNAGNLFNSFF